LKYLLRTKKNLSYFFFNDIIKNIPVKISANASIIKNLRNLKINIIISKPTINCMTPNPALINGVDLTANNKIKNTMSNTIIIVIISNIESIFRLKNFIKLIKASF